jgi:hypothetical protein
MLPKGAVIVRSIDGVPVSIVLLFDGNGRSAPIYPDARPVRDKGATFSNLSKDTNAEFLSWYGFSISSYRYSSCSSLNCNWASTYMDEAIPIKGAGKTVSTIRVPNVGGSFTVGLYTDASDAPGQLIPGASGTAYGTYSGFCCTQLVTVTISPTMPKAKTTYWIVENAPFEDDKDEVTWLGEDTDFAGDGKSLVKYYQAKGWYTSRHQHSSHYTSPWEGATSLTEPAAEVE